jgi:2'-5' RNA ligase
VAAALSGLVGTAARVEGLSLWPGRERPAVVKLDLDAGGRLRGLRDSVESVVRGSGGTVDRDPVPPHITLFKSADVGERPDALLRGGARRLEAVEGDYGGWRVEFGGYRVEGRR